MKNKPHPTYNNSLTFWDLTNIVQAALDWICMSVLIWIVVNSGNTLFIVILGYFGSYPHFIVMVFLLKHIYFQLGWFTEDDLSRHDKIGPTQFNLVCKWGFICMALSLVVFSLNPESPTPEYQYPKIQYLIPHIATVQWLQLWERGPMILGCILAYGTFSIFFF